jgi:hypothetical protein
MSVNCRFALDEKRNVIDAVNVANSGKAYLPEGFPVDERHLRQSVLEVCLTEMLKKLIIEEWPEQDVYEERLAIWVAIVGAIEASHLNSFDPTVSIQHKFDGKLIRQKEHTQDFTSLSLFRDDVECLLRDLYGDLESEALDSVVLAVFLIVQQFTRYVRPDLWKEHADAQALDYIFGIGVPEGEGIYNHDHSRGLAGKFRLINRVREVNDKPSRFSDYTIEFASLFAQQWDCRKGYEFTPDGQVRVIGETLTR